MHPGQPPAGWSICRVSDLGESSVTLAMARAITAVAGAIAAKGQHDLGALWDGIVLNSAQWWQRMSPKAYAPYPGSRRCCG